MKSLSSQLNTLKDVALPALFITFACIILVRVMVYYYFLVGLGPLQPKFFIFEYTHTFLGVLFTLFFLMAIVYALADIALHKVTVLTTLLSVVVILPPFVDRFVSYAFLHGGSVINFYLFDSPQGLLTRFFTFFGDSPNYGITYGMRFFILVAILTVGTLIYITTRSYWRTLVGMVSTYVSFFLFAILPSLLAYLILFIEGAASFTDISVAGKIASTSPVLWTSPASISAAINLKMTIVYLCLMPLFFTAYFWAMDSKRFLAFIVNTRITQIIFHGAFFTAGITAALVFTETRIIADLFSLGALLVVFMSILAAWVSSVMLNDYADRGIDQMSNDSRPLPQHLFSGSFFLAGSIVFLVLSIILLLIVFPDGIVFLLTYHAITLLYNIPPLRLKKYPFVATFLSACALLMVVFIGYAAVSGDFALILFPNHISIYIIFALTLGLPIKDFKDIDGDRAHHVWTLPVLLGEKKARLVVGASIFLSFIFLAQMTGHNIGFVMSIICGSISFAIITSRRNNLFFFAPRELPSLLLMTSLLFFASLGYAAAMS